MPEVLLPNRTKSRNRKTGSFQRTPIMLFTVRVFVLVFIALALLSACGGGSGGKKQSDPPPPPPVDTTMNWDDDNWDAKDWQ